MGRLTGLGVGQIAGPGGAGITNDILSLLYPTRLDGISGSPAQVLEFLVLVKVLPCLDVLCLGGVLCSLT